MSIDLCIFDKCNNNCLMCTNPDKPWPAWDGSFDYDYDSIIKRVNDKEEEIKKEDCIYITGGEPTLHPRFLEILEFLTKNFPHQTIKLLTNGRRFYYEDFTKDFLSINQNIEIELSIYGHNGILHNEITQSEGSFKQTVSGLENLLLFKKEEQQIAVRFVISQKSYKNISDFLGFLYKHFPNLDRVIMMFMEYEGHVDNNLEGLKLTYEEAKPFINRCEEYLDKFKDLRFYHFPLCSIDKKFWPFCFSTWPDREVEFIDECLTCSVKSRCVGIHKGYLSNIGKDEFRKVI